MKNKNIFNGMGFAGRLGKLGDVIESLQNDVAELKKMQRCELRLIRTAALMWPNSSYHTAQKRQHQQHLQKAGIHSPLGRWGAKYLILIRL